jgi:cytochrome c biogenesis protein CcdA
MGKDEERGRYSGLFAYGAAYGLASMGCQAPVFIALILAAFFAGGFMNALLVFVLFGLGMALMMVTVTVLVGKAKAKVIVRLRGLMPLMKRVSGAILIIAGVYLTWVYVSVL